MPLPRYRRPAIRRGLALCRTSLAIGDVTPKSSAETSAAAGPACKRLVIHFFAVISSDS